MTDISRDQMLIKSRLSIALSYINVTPYVNPDLTIRCMQTEIY